MFRRVTGLVALATFIGALLLPSVTVTHAWNDADLSGGASLRLAGHVDTSLEAPGPAGADEHCALCHWLRSLGTSVVAGPAPVAVPAGAGPGPFALTLPLLAAAGAGCSARAPPSFRVA